MRAVAAALVEASVVGVKAPFPLLAEGDEVWVGDVALRVVRLDADGLVAEGSGGTLRIAVAGDGVQATGAVPGGAVPVRSPELRDGRVVRSGGDRPEAASAGGVLRIAVAGDEVLVSGVVPEGIAERVSARVAELREARVVVGAAIVAGGRLLVQERGFPAEVAGKWELPGGRVEPGESDVDALRRECREELGVRVEVGEPVGVDVPLRRDLVLRVYSASVVEGEVAALEHRGVRWVGSVELAQVDWLPADRVLVPALGELLG